MVRALALATSLALTQVSGRGALAQAPIRLLDQVVLEVTGVEDSAQYLVYRYRVLNSASSRSGVAGISLDLSAPRGTGFTILPSTGPYMDGAAMGVGPVTDHVPVGIIEPDGWKAALMRNAILNWYPFEGYLTENGTAAPFSKDSAPPGGSKEGFGLRSPFLAAIRRFSAEPTLASCCSRPTAGSPEGEYPPPGAFRVRRFTVAPTVPPQDMGLRLVQADLQQTCGPLRWIADGAVCRSLRSNLARAIASQQGDRSAAVSSLRTFLSELEGNHGPGKPVNDNAYWLLKVNGEYLLKQM